MNTGRWTNLSSWNVVLDSLETILRTTQCGQVVTIHCHSPCRTENSSRWALQQCSEWWTTDFPLVHVEFLRREDQRTYCFLPVSSQELSAMLWYKVAAGLLVDIAPAFHCETMPLQNMLVLAEPVSNTMQVFPCAQGKGRRSCGRRGSARGCLRGLSRELPRAP